MAKPHLPISDSSSPNYIYSTPPTLYAFLLLHSLCVEELVAARDNRSKAFPNCVMLELTQTSAQLSRSYPADGGAVMLSRLCGEKFSNGEENSMAVLVGVGSTQGGF